MKKLLSLVLALVMVLMAVSALAAEITVNETATYYKYKVYQIYTGTLSEEAKLSDILYGANYGTTGTAVPASELEGITEGNIRTKAKDFYANLHDDPVATITYDTTNGYKATGLAAGYYLVIEEYASGASQPAGTELSRNIIKVANDITISPKRGTTTQDKEINADTLGDPGADSFTDATNRNEDNLSVGDIVEFKISTAVSANAVEYDHYFFVVEDTMSAGLTYNGDNNLVVTIDGQTKRKDTDYNVTSSVDSSTNVTTLKIGLIDAKAYAGKSVVVTYKATLNERAVIGEEGNPNVSKVRFSNDPHHNYNGDKDSTNPGFPDSTKTVPTGETTEDRTKTYTTGIQIKKVDQDGNVLKGAAFTISGNSEKIVLVSSETWAENASGAYYGLNSGAKTLTAPQAADEMVAAAAGATAGYVVAEAGYAEADAVTVGGTTYRPYKPTEDNGKTVYKLLKANSDLYDGKRYSKTVSYSQQGNVSSTDVTATVGDDGIVEFNGLGAGTYTISESTTPTGYNTIADFTVTIDFTAEPTAPAKHFTATSTGGTVTYEDGVFKMTVENRSGTTLPSTGGIGTTIFYIVGGLLVIGAAVILVARRKAHE